jgi:Ca2+-binding EF-hand superfamily protein
MKDFRTLEKEEFSIIFNKFDLDRNGKITKKEMTGFILSLAGFC